MSQPADAPPGAPGAPGSPNPPAPRRPSSPRSPRPIPGSLPSSLPPGALAGFAAPPPPPRPNVGSLLFLTAFFFFMSGGNQMPEPTITVGPDGQIMPRVTELDRAREYVNDYKGFLNGTGNWTEVGEIPIAHDRPDVIIRVR